MSAGEWTDTGNLFRLLADIDYQGVSPLYERLARGAADDPDVLSLLRAAAPPDRLPHLLFAAVQYLLLLEGSTPIDTFGSNGYDEFRSWCLDHREPLQQVLATRVVQTNEVGRCAALLPCLARVAATTGQPLALIEVGASAGLNLRLDRYHYTYDGDAIGASDSAVRLRPRLEGELVPTFALPDVVWRRGLDRMPIDVTDDTAVMWLRACIWPEQRWRADLLEAAVADARRDPPPLITGDATADLPDLVAAAPEDAAVCVVHTAVLPYLPDRAGFVTLLDELGRDRPLWWVSGEGRGLVEALPVPVVPVDRLSFLYGVVHVGPAPASPQVLGLAGSHGAWLAWLDPTTGRPRRSRISRAVPPRH